MNPSITFPTLRSPAPALGPAYCLGSGRTRKLSETQKRVRDAILAADREGDYENKPCLCGDPDNFVILSQVERHGLPYRALLCGSCGLIRCSPRWNQQRYEQFYSEQYRDLYNTVHQSKRAYSILQKKSLAVADIARWIFDAWDSTSKTRNPPTILEIGAGGGWNLACLPENWKKIGYDVDDEFLEIGRNEFGLDMRRGFLAETLRDVETADIILLSHVLEHLLDPVGDLKTIARHMKDDALLCIEVPGIFRIHSSNLDVMSYMQNAHTYTFCKQTLSETIQSAGLKVIHADEHARATAAKKPVVVSRTQRTCEGALLSRTTLAYLLRCEARYSWLRPLAKLPFGGGRLMNLARKTVFRNLMPCELAGSPARLS